MKGETFMNGMNAKTSNWNATGGSVWDALIQGDRVAVMMACDAPDLIWAYAFSFNDTGLSYDLYRQKGYKFKRLADYHKEVEQGVCKFKTENEYERVNVSCSMDAFAHMLKPWIYSKYYEWCDSDPLPKRIQKAARASEEINKGLALYLSKNPKEEVRIAKYFRPIPATTFDRKYKKFAIMASRNLYRQLTDLGNQIAEFTKKEEKY